MAESDEEEVFARLADELRLPGEIFTDEWVGYAPRYDGPPISTIWLMSMLDGKPNEALELGDEEHKAWDLLCDDATFRRWYEDHEDSLSSGNYLTVDDGGAETLRFSRTGNLNMRVPIETLRTSGNVEAEFNRIIVAMLRRRAEKAGVPSPPRVD